MDTKEEIIKTIKNIQRKIQSKQKTVKELEQKRDELLANNQLDLATQADIAIINSDIADLNTSIFFLLRDQALFTEQLNTILKLEESTNQPQPN